jgi:hypothetical protein
VKAMVDLTAAVMAALATLQVPEKEDDEQQGHVQPVSD